MFITKEKRKELKLTQRDLAKRFGVSIVSIQNWENGVQEPSDENKDKIKKFLEEVENGKI